jgi:RND family efflux transporter MFP subunit
MRPNVVDGNPAGGLAAIAPPPRPTERRRATGIALALSLVALATLGLAGCQEGAAVEEAEQIRPVRLITAGETQDLTARRFVGRVDAVSTVDLSFQVGGRIADIPVRQGTLLAEGETIATLEPDDYELALREAQLQYDLAARDLERKRELVAREAISTAAFEQSEIEYRLRRVALDNAERNRAHTTITAPFDALVTRRLADPFANVQAGTPIVRVQDVTELRVHINVPENVIGLVANPEMFRIEAIFPDRPDAALPLTYREHATEPDAIAQTYQVTLALEQPFDGTILPGMTVSVRVSLAAGIVQEAMTLPISAIDTAPEGDFRVWVYDPDRQSVSAREVALGDVGEDRIAVREGVAPGEQVVAAGAHLMREGLRVRPFDSF